MNAPILHAPRFGFPCSRRFRSATDERQAARGRPRPGLQWLTVLLAAALFGLAGPASAGDDAEINEIVVFGDSLSDTGNVFTLTGLDPSLFGTQLPASPTWFDGRFTNGPVWHEVLAEGLELPTAAASLVGGSNYAWGGAEYGSGFAETGVPNVGTQILEFLGSRGGAESEQLFVINGGNNDFIPPGAPADPRELADAVVEHVSTLAAAGARHFVVPNSAVDETRPGLNPPLDAALFFPDVPTEEAKAEILDNARRFNRLLRVKLFWLEWQLNRQYEEPVTITYLNIARAQEIILRHPAFFGFENVSDPAVDTGPFPPTCFCGGFVPPGVDPDLYFYFDIVHPTARVHEIYGHLALLNVRWKLALAKHRH